MKAKTKTEAIEELIGVLEKANLITDPKDVLDRVLERERIDTTAVGEGVAFPHARLEASEVPIIAVGRSTKGIDFEAIDGSPVNLMVLVIWQPATTGLFNHLFGELVKNFSNKFFRSELMEAKGANGLAKKLVSINMGFASGIKPFAKTRILLKLQDLTLQKNEEKEAARQMNLIKSELDPDIVRRFERLITRDGKALWDIKNGTCTGCMLRLSNKYDQIVKTSKNIFICEHCGRFIYYPSLK
jgi:mannitol/fructose-specific phosphotransferase system IIA component (Ntr-type)